MPLNTLASIAVSKHQIPAWKGSPNTSIQQKPLLIYHQAFSDPSATAVEAYLKSVGVVEPQWRYTMYSKSHFHSISHEVLCIVSGAAKCCFGHEDNPDRVEPVLTKGDVVIVPAGVAHRLLEDHGEFQMVGSYPIGHGWDMCYGSKGQEDKLKNISKLGWFKKDPIFGDQGPALDV